MAQEDIKHIVWPEGRLVLGDQTAWKKNVQVVKMLSAMGAITEWQDGSSNNDTYVHMPYRYDIGGITVEFLPHWNFYRVGGLCLTRMPDSESEVRAAVKAVKKLQSLGYNLRQ